MAAQPHYIGHRQRLRQRFLADSGESLADYELLELILAGAKPRGDVKPLAKALLKEFGSLSGVLYGSTYELKKLDGMGDAAIAALKATLLTAQRIQKAEIQQRPVIQSWDALLDYCRLKMGHEKVEQFRLLFLDHKHHLIADEMQQKGTVNHTPVYTREVVKRALEVGASAIILAHNHPSGDPSPSQADISMTRDIAQASSAVGITVHDHLIITRAKHYSFKSHGLL